MKLLIAALLMGVVVNVSNAQSEEITDENLRRYALLMESVDAMKAEISVALNDMIKNQEGMTGKRFSELSKGEGEAATEFETKFMATIEEMKAERIEAIKEVNQLLATKMLPDGGKTYKAIKAAISSDDAVKARYEAILAKVQLAEEGA
ncbi:hypothetical protein [Fulvivirga lutimaris]|uniref:hypothetical protein n=1 Tax=Fulvivirga lutimaris TaxID=1819566 RepID=UPI0012BC81A5|nr:hypothetical protein [Fulvivirga lutimaris]MTI38511.1 hypothetical protein [Fulvivirga lutimaris]